jgi:hypothetical protein
MTHQFLYKRREFIRLLGSTAVWPLAAHAQQPGKLPLVGVLVSASPPHPFADALRRGLQTLGYSKAVISRSSSVIPGGVAIALARLRLSSSDLASTSSSPTLPQRSEPQWVPHKRSQLSWRRPALPCNPVSSRAWLAPAETSRVYRRWMRRLAANACSFSAISFRVLPGSRFSHQTQTRLVDRSWRTSAWPPHEPASGLFRYWSAVPMSSKAPSRPWPRPMRRR